MNLLLSEITHCAVLEASKSGAPGPCKRIVDVQSQLPLAAHQVPEPWTGDIEQARILFISSNPSIDFDEPFPVWSDEASSTNEFFMNRFGDQPGQIKDGMYPPVEGGGWGPAVRFWSSVRQRAFEVLPGAVPGADYALTEVVHCKSRNEIGVREARSTCAERYLPRIIDAATKAKLFVVFGVHAAQSVAEVLDIKLDATQRVARLERGGVQQTVVYLDHPAGAGKVKRLEIALSSQEFEEISRELAGP